MLMELEICKWEQVRPFILQFRKLDVDGSGRLGLDDLKSGFEEKNERLSPMQRQMSRSRSGFVKPTGGAPSPSHSACAAKLRKAGSAAMITSPRGAPHAASQSAPPPGHQPNELQQVLQQHREATQQHEAEAHSAGGFKELVAAPIMHHFVDGQHYGSHIVPGAGHAPP